MKASNSFTPAKTKSQSRFSNVINAPSTRQMIDKSVGDPVRAAALVSTLISAVNASDALRSCDPGSIISAALRGEIGMGLSLAMGQYSIVPYGSTATFQIAAKGLKQMAVRSGKYSAMGFFDVREGEYKGRNPLTREPKFQWIEDEEQRLALPIIGYYGFYKLNEENNSFFQCIYWSHEQILRHADRYSKAFSREKYDQLLSGQLAPEEVEKLRRGSPWYDLPDSVPHQKMCMKTIAIQLLNDGMAPLEVQQAINADNVQEASGNPVVYDDDIFAAQVVAEAEAIEEQPQEAASAPQQQQETEYKESEKTAGQGTSAATGRKKTDVSAMDNFFGEA